MAISQVFERFIQPIKLSLEINSGKRNCNTFTDEDFIAMCLHRVLGEDKSGLAFLQRALSENILAISATIFFKALSSKRRLQYLLNIQNNLVDYTNKMLAHNDIFQQFQELNDFDIYASDGSYHWWACHDERLEKKITEKPEERNEAHKGTKRSCQHFYSINLRTQVAQHLAFALIGGERQNNNNRRATHTIL